MERQRNVPRVVQVLTPVSAPKRDKHRRVVATAALSVTKGKRRNVPVLSVSVSALNRDNRRRVIKATVLPATKGKRPIAPVVMVIVSVIKPSSDHTQGVSPDIPLGFVFLGIKKIPSVNQRDVMKSSVFMTT